jgi:hypothetical protein
LRKKDIVDFDKLNSILQILDSKKNLKHFDTHFKESELRKDYLALKVGQN